jgi:flagellar M-ring protein FliF
MDMAALTENIKAMPLKQKTMLVSVLVMVITAVILLITWSQKPDYQILYSNLSEEDSGAIIQKLKDQKVPYKASASGVMVPSDKVYELRLQMASQGLPQGGSVGFELFDKSNFTMTDFVQKLNYLRALQGELTRTIRALSEIEQCRVHLAVPERSLFAKEEEKPKASILLKLKQGRSLSQGQIQGIVHLVSSSVEGLNPKDVSIVNQNGEMLTSGSDDTLTMSQDQLAFQQKIEKELESSIVGILEPVVGKGKIMAKVTATLDFTKIEKTEERFDPDSQVVRSEQKNTEKSTTGKSGGVPGVASNMPGKTESQMASNHGQSEKKNEVTNYEISRITSHVINTPGDLKRISAAVLLDGTYPAQQGSKERKYTPRSEEDLKKFEDMVKSAIGFTQDRGDEVKVVNMPFEPVPQEEFPEAKKDFMPIILTVAKYAVPLLAVIFLLLFVIKPLMKTISTAPASQRQFASLPLPQTVAELERTMDASGKPASQNVIEWAKRNPKDAANLIKNWIEEK